MNSFNLDDRTTKYVFYRSDRATRLRITVTSQQVRITVPRHVSLEQAHNFLETHKNWVIKCLKKQQKKAEINRPKKYVCGEKFLYRGRNYPLIIKYTSESDFYATFKGSRIIVYVPSGLDDEQQSLLIKDLLKKWYIKQAKKILPEQVDYYSKQLNIPYNKLRIKDQKSRWGSCSNKGTINLNWRIIMAPNQVSAYVIIHELSHLKHMNHSSDFWFVVENYLPDYKKWKKWLAQNGDALMLL